MSSNFNINILKMYSSKYNRPLYFHEVERLKTLLTLTLRVYGSYKINWSKRDLRNIVTNSSEYLSSKEKLEGFLNNNNNNNNNNIEVAKQQKFKKKETDLSKKVYDYLVSIQNNITEITEDSLFQILSEKFQDENIEEIKKISSSIFKIIYKIIDGRKRNRKEVVSKNLKSFGSSVRYVLGKSLFEKLGKIFADKIEKKEIIFNKKQKDTKGELINLNCSKNTRQAIINESMRINNLEKGKKIYLPIGDFNIGSVRTDELIKINEKLLSFSGNTLDEFIETLQDRLKEHFKLILSMRYINGKGFDIKLGKRKNKNRENKYDLVITKIL